MGTTSEFSGSIFAMESITATTGVSIHGKLLAIDGAVTLDGVTLLNDLPEPTLTPTATPSLSPSVSPSATPSVSPSVSPTAAPTAAPSVSLSVSPSAAPTSSNPATGDIPASALPLWIFLIIGSTAILFQFLKSKSRRN
ncbi:MAG: ice-binding family protein [Saccharofermentanales bacterium]